MSRRLTERDLRHDADADRFGAAMVKCEGFSPACSTEGRCERGGECFASSPNIVAARMIEAIIPTDGRAGLHLAYLRAVTDMLRRDRVAL